MTTFYEETQARNEAIGRLGRMIDQVRRAENSLREAVDERRSLGGGSRARIGNLLACVEDATEYVQREARRIATDYPVGRVPDAERVA
jgi:hypothetical protein